MPPLEAGDGTGGALLLIAALYVHVYARMYMYVYVCICMYVQYVYVCRAPEDREHARQHALSHTTLASAQTHGRRLT
jgi:hypothetical protein